MHFFLKSHLEETKAGVFNNKKTNSVLSAEMEPVDLSFSLNILKISTGCLGAE